ncbi:MAG: lysophospholipase [Candidatus Omnitrophica bacterium]|nr:lysophospholipase [Candidatus Omnitrophota bacterium]MCK5287548.1 lysophospholipase [Candidatus Omnitrophota bacterium]MCK5393822.1 lysophospholipase [Candidatus Omnitrophota bacterium]MCK5492259.1 lysophospholipase [Candidatus Omnitrophota bacterium]
MYKKEMFFKNNEGLKLLERCWKPNNDSKAVVILVHGYAEHSARYNYFAQQLVKNKYSVYSFDLRGHGLSEGIRVFVSTFKEYLDDLDKFLERVRKLEKGKPIFIMGCSLGGTIVTSYVIENNPEVEGIILIAALLKIPEHVPLYIRKTALVVGRVLPYLPLLKKVDSSLLSRDLAVNLRYQNDPLVYHGKMLAGEAVAINNGIKKMQGKINLIKLPLLIMHGTADCITDVDGSKQIYKNAGSPDKILKLYKGFYHDLMNDPDKKKLLTDLVSWLDIHV